MDNTYFIFDMDETIAELYSVYYFIATLKICNKYKNIPNSLIQSLDDAYKVFIKKVLNKEKSNEPLGILRPGILDVMVKLLELQKKDKIKNVAIYSNNGHLESLEFIRDIIHSYIGSKTLIKECIHWYHPMRNEERMDYPGAANKTWNVLKNILVKGNCKASSEIVSESVYFFDDLDHNDLKKNLGDNYYKVPGYSFKASFDRLSDIFKDSLKEVNITDLEILKNIVFKEFNIKDNILNNKEEDNIDVIIKIFNNKTKEAVTSNIMPPLPDNGINMMMNAINKVDALKGGKIKRNIKGVSRRNIKTKMRIRMRTRKN